MLAIDAHAHLGPCRVFDSDQRPEDLISAMDRHGIDASVVQPFPGAPDPASVHDMIAQLAKDHPGRIFGMASLTPHQDPGAYRAEVARCVRELGFVAVKAHVLGHAINPRTRDARLVFETAAELKIPVMIHTGHGVPFAEPAMWIPLAREFSETTVILGHAGAPMFTGAAIVAGEVASNIVLETSWCSPHDIGRAIRTLGPERVLFGSDLQFNPGVELAKYHAIGLDEDVLRLTLAANAVRVYSLDVPEAVS
jgi:predicted TIM-barrel fold metal-dependent hydrolase